MTPLFAWQPPRPSGTPPEDGNPDHTERYRIPPNPNEPHHDPDRIAVSDAAAHLRKPPQRPIICPVARKRGR